MRMRRPLANTILQSLSSVVPQTDAEVLSVLYQNRGITNPAAFLEPTNPLAMSLKEVLISSKKLVEAAKIIYKTLELGEQIVIYGDYDADGICATAVLWQTIHSLWQQQEKKGPVPLPFIPHRRTHGYGLSQLAIDEIISKHNPQVLITVDNGIVAHAEIAYAQSKGIHCIVTDHHEPEEKDGAVFLPEAEVVVHSTKLCGTTVAWFLSRQLAKEKLPEHFVEQLFDLCGFATIADQVPLESANRSFAYFGIRALRSTQRVGLLELAKVAQKTIAEATEETIGFSLAPRINAMGRLEHGLEALRLLCTENVAVAQASAAILTQTNEDRQTLTAEQLEIAVEQAESQQNEHILVLHSPEYHEGIIGLIASNVTEKYNKPSLVISMLPNGVCKGSARSIPGVSVVGLLRAVRSDLLSVGGHRMAGGCSLEYANLEKVSQRLFAAARATISSETLQKTELFECDLPLRLVSTDLHFQIMRLAPFGMGNSKPVFKIGPATVLSVQTIGKQAEHIKFIIGNPHSSESITLLGWGMAAELKHVQKGQEIETVAFIETSEFRGKTQLQLVARYIGLVKN